MRYALLLVLILFAEIARACPSCYGANDSPMAAGMNMAIFTMLGITGAVLAAIVAFFIFMWRRYNRQRLALSERSCVTQDGRLKLDNEKGVMEWNNF